MITQVPAGRAILDDGSRGASPSSRPPGVEAAPSGRRNSNKSGRLRLETPNRLEGAEEIVKRHLDEALAGIGEEDVWEALALAVTNPSLTVTGGAAGKRTTWYQILGAIIPHYRLAPPKSEVPACERESGWQGEAPIAPARRNHDLETAIMKLCNQA